MCLILTVIDTYPDPTYLYLLPKKGLVKHPDVELEG